MYNKESKEKKNRMILTSNDDGKSFAGKKIDV